MCSGLATQIQLKQEIPFHFQTVVNSPHSAVNTRSWRAHLWITSISKNTNKGFLNSSHSVPWKLTESTNTVNIWKTKALSHQWHYLLSPFGSSQQQQPELPWRDRHGTPPHDARLSGRAAFFSLIEITEKKVAIFFKPDGGIIQRCARGGKKQCRRTQQGFTADWNNPHAVDWHSPKGEREKQAEKTLNNGFPLQY